MRLVRLCRWDVIHFIYLRGLCLRRARQPLLMAIAAIAYDRNAVGGGYRYLRQLYAADAAIPRCRLRLLRQPVPRLAGTALSRYRPPPPIALSGTLRCLLLQQLATADTLVTPDTVYKMYGVTQQQSCV